jgi:SAM-dependent methyltransferase
MSLWASADLARAYADVRGELPASLRAVWGDAFRAASPPGPLRRVVDVGCGTGRFTALLAEVYGAATIGVDGSAAMLRERRAGPGARATFASADAGALPFRAASIDLVLLSMVYHLLAADGVAGAAVAELHRVVRPAGRVLLRTPSLELIDTIAWLPFFPGARAIDEGRLPARRRIVTTFEEAGFAMHAHRAVAQEFARSPRDALEKIRRRPFSTLRLLPDAAFEEGLASYARHCQTAPPTPLIEPLDFFVFDRP